MCSFLLSVRACLLVLPKLVRLAITESEYLSSSGCIHSMCAFLPFFNLVITALTSFSFAAYRFTSIHSTLPLLFELLSLVVDYSVPCMSPWAVLPADSFVDFGAI